MAEKLKIINLEGSLGIEQAEATRNLFLSELNQKSGINVNLSRVTAFDLSIIQVILSAQSTALQQNSSFNYANQVSEAAWDAFAKAGFIDAKHSVNGNFQQGLLDFFQLSGGKND